MGLYDSGFDFRFGEAKKIAFSLGIGVLAVILVVLVLFFAGQFLRTEPLQFRFEKNPIKTGEQTKVFITVTNISGGDLENVPLSLSAKEKAEYDIYALNEKFDGKISQLSKGTSREVTFIINPIGKILRGTYTLVARTNLNGVDHVKEATLTVQE